MNKKMNNKINDLLPEDKAFHDWYRFVLSYPPHLVRKYIDKFNLSANNIVLDPFCGTGTTVVECKKRGIPSYGIEANPIAEFASKTKVKWDIDHKKFMRHSLSVAKKTDKAIQDSGFVENSDLPLFTTDESQLVLLRDLDEDQWKILSKPWMSPIPLHKTLILLNQIRDKEKPWSAHQELALARALVKGIGNIRFGPEIGATKPKLDAPVVELWIKNCEKIYTDLSEVDGNKSNTLADVYSSDVRSSLPPEIQGIDCVITSPPYPNEKDYTRTTRLESVILGYLRNRQELRDLKQSLIRSNTRNVYKADDDNIYVQGFKSISDLSKAIEDRRIELGKTSGFERLYHRVVPLYFGGMKRHLLELQSRLNPGARLAYVVGDQMSYLRVHIKTGEIMAEIAESIGYKVEGIELWRERFATATKTQLREEVVVLSFDAR